jgi:CRISPR-associated endoribonuclease Cas6
VSETPDLLALTLRLRPSAEAPPERPPTRWWGRAAHALLLETAARSDPALAERLHAGDGLRPFTCSSLAGRLPDWRAVPAEVYSLRFTALTAETAGLLAAAAGPAGELGQGRAIELDYQPFRVEAAQVESTGYAALSTAHLFGSEPPRKLRLRFLSPTGFHSAGRHQPLPLPELVFGSLLERWNAFAPLAFPLEARRYAAECLAVSRFELASKAIPAKDGGLRVGCVGWAEYTALTYDRYWLGILGALAAFAAYGGAGAGTSFGFGRCAAG